MLKLYGALVLLAAAPAAAGLQSTDQPAAPPLQICHSNSVKEDEVPGPAKAILTGYGTGGFTIRTSSPQAQAYFDDGMQLAHAFAHKAAIAAFKRAEVEDPTCALCVWGEAWSRGPTINYPLEPKDEAELAALADKAAVLAADGPPKERALIAALQKRYHGGGGGGRGDEAFAAAMDDLARANPSDNEIAVVTADAWMIPVTNDGHGRLPRAVELLEGALQRQPKDTGAIHFYIHATEMSGFGTRALPYAETLQALAPAASHLVHMPSHTYFWSGRYRQAEASNLDAVEIDKANAERLKPKDGVFGLIYHGHNVQFGEGAALMDGDGKGGLALAATELTEVGKVKPDESFKQVWLGTAYFVYGRYGSKGEVAALPDPGPKLAVADAMWIYAKGEAASREGDAAGVKAQAAALQALRPDMKPFKDFRPQAQAMIDVARLVLTGRAAMLEQRWSDAEAAYRRAAEIQEAKLGRTADPPAWWYPVRRSLAAALLAQGRTRDAAAEAQKALNRWAYDPIALRLLADCATKEGRPDDARRNLTYARANWTGDVETLPLSAL